MMILPKDVRIPAILMAAGKSTRMGRNKLLLPFNNHSVIAETADRLLSANVSKVIAVLGNNYDQVAEQLKDKQVETVLNPDFAQGMITSLKTGLGLLSEDDSFFMIALGDQPLVTKSAYNALIEATAFTSKKIFIPTYGGQRGNPIILSTSYIDEIMEMNGDIGGREIIRKYPQDIREIPVTNEGVIINMNTPDLYDYWLNEFNKGRYI